MAAPLVGLDQHLVGDEVELFLHLALHVGAARTAQHLAQRAFVDADGDALAGARHDFDQQAQLGRNAAVDALLLDQVAGEGGAWAHGVGFFTELGGAVVWAEFRPEFRLLRPRRG